MKFDDFLQWSLKLNSKFDRKDAEDFVKMINVRIDCNLDVAHYHHNEFKRFDNYVDRDVAIRDAVKKKIKEYDLATKTKE